MIKQFREKIFEQAKQEGFSDCEIYFASDRSFSVKIFKGEISEYKNANSMGLCFRGTYNGRMGYAHSEKISLDVIPFLVESAKNNSEVIETKERELLYEGDPVYPETNCFSEKLEAVTAAEKIELAKVMEKEAYALDSRIKNVDYCSVSSGESFLYLSNSLGGKELEDRSNYAIAYVDVIAEDNGQTKTGMEFFAENDFSSFDPKALAKTAVEKALAYLGAVSIKSGRYAVVFDNMTFADLLSAFLEVFFADTVEKGFSLLKGKLGETVAGPKVTVRDDGLLKGAVFSVPFDSEGVAVKNKCVIENGKLVTYLHNLKTARASGVEPTGNGFKTSIKSAVKTAATNFYLKPSELSNDGLLKQMGEGILITELSGLHAGVNSISGDFSLLASGFLVKDGEIGRSVEQITVAGNFFQLLNDIIEVSSDLRLSMPSSLGVVGAPYVYVKGLDIAGEGRPGC